VQLANIRFTGVRLADLRPQAVRSFMERQLTMASVPIVRYYDHLQFVYEVESRVRELRSQSEGEGNGNGGQQKETQPVTPGQTRQNPGQRPGRERERATEGTREQGREHAGSPAAEPADATYGVLEVSLVRTTKSLFGETQIVTTGPSTPFGAQKAPNSARDDTMRFSADFRSEGAVSQEDSAQSGGSALRAWERSKIWIA
jgi:hypothetical protein